MTARKIKVGQIGLGDWGKNLLRNFIGIINCQVAVACDSNGSTCLRVTEMFPGLATTGKYENLLDDSALDAIIIATPPALHYEMAMRAIEAGKDVFVEKPLVLDLEQGKKLVALAQKNNRILMVGHIMLYHPASLLLKKYIDCGELGEIHYLYSQRINLGKVRDIENSLWSFAPHDISLMMFLLGKMPVRVNATGAAYLQKNVEDVCFITIQFEDKTLAHIHVSWLDPHKIRKLTIVGSKKMAVFNDTESAEKIWLYDKGINARLDYSSYSEYMSLRIGDITLPRVPGGEPLRAECLHFLECVATRQQPRSDGRDGLRVLAVLQAAQQSLERGGVPVEIPEIN